jgi:hypothetical protein
MCISRKMGRHVVFNILYNKIVHLGCSKVVSAPRAYTLGCHYAALHKEKFGLLEGKLIENKRSEM